MKFKFPPDRDDAELAKRWRGYLVRDWASPVTWRDGVYYCGIEPPQSVTFPICSVCGHIIWDWPHFEEQPPSNAACDRCADESAERS
jgi:hypothetical protein